MIEKFDASIENLSEYKYRIRGKSVEFRNEVLELLKTLDDDKILLIKNVDFNYYQNVRVHIGSKSNFAKSLNKIFGTSYDKNKTMYIYIKESYDKKN